MPSAKCHIVTPGPRRPELLGCFAGNDVSLHHLSSSVLSMTYKALARVSWF